MTGDNPWVARLMAESLRCFERIDVRFEPGFNILAGANAQGKTTILEGVHLAATGRILRDGRDTGAVREGASRATVEIELAGPGTVMGVELRPGVKKRATLNGVGLPRASDLLGRLPVVAFSASALEIVRGEPTERRDFLDTELAQVYPAYLRHITVYKRALEHRNALLRQAQEAFLPPEVFAPWEAALAEHGSALREARREWITDLAEEAIRAHGELGGGEDLRLTYEPKDAAMSPAELGEALENRRDDDVRRGGTSVGPHRDDLRIDVGGRDARPYGSQGQQRTAVIALKLATQALVQRAFGRPPVLLLDDVFSDLDQTRRSALVQRAMQAGGQVFLTCTEAAQAGEDLCRQATVYRVWSGSVERA